MKKLLLIAIATLLPINGQAAVSGFYDSAEQISTILGSSAVADTLQQAPIGMIVNSGTRKDGAAEWTITVQECDVKVYLKPIPPKGIGKTTYEIDDIGPCE